MSGILQSSQSPPTLSPTPPLLGSCDYSEWSPTWALIPSIYMLAFTLGSMGNGLVLWVYIKWPHQRRHCIKAVPGRTSPHCRHPASSCSLTTALITSLAAADMAFVLTLPLWATYTALGYHWPFGQLLCKLSSYLVALNMYASVFSLTGLSVERYWVISRRLGTQHSWSQVLWTVGGVWVAAGILALPALLLRTVIEVEEEAGPGNSGWWQGQALHPLKSCEMDYSSLITAKLPEEREHLELLWVAAMGMKSTLLAFLLPLAVLILCYSSLGCLLSHHFGNGPQPAHHRQRHLLRVIATLVSAFFLCWLPFHANKTLSILMQLELLPYSCAFDWVLVAAYPYTTCLAYINSCLNPLLYACCNPGFRHHCRTLLDGCCRRRGGEDERNWEEPSRSSVVPSRMN